MKSMRQAIAASPAFAVFETERRFSVYTVETTKDPVSDDVLLSVMDENDRCQIACKQEWLMRYIIEISSKHSRHSQCLGVLMLVYKISHRHAIGVREALVEHFNSQ